MKFTNAKIRDSVGVFVDEPKSFRLDGNFIFGDKRMSIWVRLREIADKAEAQSNAALSEEAARVLTEYKSTRLEDPLDLSIRVPKPTAWQHQALKLIASNVVGSLIWGSRGSRFGPQWDDFIRRTKPDHSGDVGPNFDLEFEELRHYVLDDLDGWKLNRLGLAVLAELEDDQKR